MQMVTIFPILRVPVLRREAETTMKVSLRGRVNHTDSPEAAPTNMSISKWLLYPLPGMTYQLFIFINH